MSTIFQVGFDAGDGLNFYALPSSRTRTIANVERETNVNVIGRYMFRTDSTTVDAVTPLQTCTGNGQQLPSPTPTILTLNLRTNL